MLTIKVIRPDRSEWIGEVTSVFFNMPEQSNNHRCSVTYFENQKDFADVYDGTVYVMNEGGKTVAKYALGYVPALKEELTDTKTERISAD